MRTISLLLSLSARAAVSPESKIHGAGPAQMRMSFCSLLFGFQDVSTVDFCFRYAVAEEKFLAESDDSRIGVLRGEDYKEKICMKNTRTTALLMLLVFLLVVSVVIIFLTGLDRPTGTDNPYQNVTVTAAPTVEVETPAPVESVEPTVEPTAVPTSAPVYYPPSTTMPSQTARPVTTATPPPGGVSVPSGNGATTVNTTPTPIPGADANMLPAAELIPVVPGANTTGDNGTAGDASQATIPVGTSLGSGSFRSDSGASINIHADWNALVSGPNTVDLTVTAYVDSYSLMTTASPEALNIAVDGQYFSLASPAIEIPTTTTPVTTKINSRTVTITLSGGETRNIPIEVVWNYRGTYGSVYLDTIECGGTVTLSR